MEFFVENNALFSYPIQFYGVYHSAKFFSFFSFKVNKPSRWMFIFRTIFADRLKREKELFKNGIYYLDCGTSGGLDSARYGACFMVDGRNEDIKIAEPGQ